MMMMISGSFGDRVFRVQSFLLSLFRVNKILSERVICHWLYLHFISWHTILNNYFNRQTFVDFFSVHVLRFGNRQIKKYHFKYKWDLYWSSEFRRSAVQVFHFSTSSFSIRKTCFHLDDSSNLIACTQQVVNMFDTTLPLGTVVFQNKVLPRVCCIRNCQMRSFWQPVHLTLILDLFVIVNNMRHLFWVRF